MTDKYTKEQRHAMMSAVRSKGNKSTELIFIKLLRNNSITGWRRHYRIEGTPDFAFPKEKIAIFIDGCFWHKCPKCYRCPKSNIEYWETKVQDNKKRDTRQTKNLRAAGWQVLRVWEHQLKTPNPTIKKLQKLLTKPKPKNQGYDKII